MNIFFFPSNTPSLMRMISIGEWFHERNHTAHIIVNRTQYELLGDLNTRNINLLDFRTLKSIVPKRSRNSSEPASASSAPHQKKSHGGHLERLAKSNSTPTLVLLSLYWALVILRFRARWKSRIKALSPDVIFVWGDNAGTTNGELIRLFKVYGAKVIHLPIAISEQSIIAQLRVKNEIFTLNSNSPIFTRILCTALPDQVIPYKGKTVLYYHPSEILGMKITNSLPEYPWIIGKSRADVTCFSFESEKEYWLGKGAAPSSIQIIGSLELETLQSDISAIMEEWRDQIDFNKSFILFNVPNFVEHKNIAEWETFWQEIERILTPMVHTGIPIVCSIHPKAEINNYQTIVDKFGCRLTQGRIASWISLSKLYVSICSSTELIASKFSIPVLDLGPIYDFESDILKIAYGVHTFHSFAEYEKALANHCSTLQSRSKFLQNEDRDAQLQSVAGAYQKLGSIVLKEPSNVNHNSK